MVRRAVGNAGEKYLLMRQGSDLFNDRFPLHFRQPGGAFGDYNDELRPFITASQVSKVAGWQKKIPCKKISDDPSAGYSNPA
jgi:hypothetical protein